MASILEGAISTVLRIFGTKLIRALVPLPLGVVISVRVFRFSSINSSKSEVQKVTILATVPALRISPTLSVIPRSRSKEDNSIALIESKPSSSKD